MKPDARYPYLRHCQLWPATVEDAKWCVEAFGHLVDVGERITGPELAVRIGLAYDANHSLKGQFAVNVALASVLHVERLPDGSFKYAIERETELRKAAEVYAVYRRACSADFIFDKIGRRNV